MSEPVTDSSQTVLPGTIGELCDRLGLASSPEQLDLLARFLTLLQRWNATYNLTAVRDPQQMLTQHLADCLAVVKPIQRQLNPGASSRLLDVGSGGGLPGAVLAIMLPGLDVTCVDTVGKKAAFVRQAAAELGLRNLHAEHARVERLTAPAFDLVVSRAFASLADFVRLSRRQVGASGVWMAMKGKRPDQEIAELPFDVETFHVEPITVPGLEADRCLVWMRPTPPIIETE
jgi:16S rRNA (guanine527-N7)-methyltransferase